MKKATKVWIWVIILVLGTIRLGWTQNDEVNVILITLDGLRWQELFSGADPLLVTNTDYVKDTSGLKQLFWRNTAEKRRKALMPFLWTRVVGMGQIHGNRSLGSKVDLTNTMWFSYPGYNEILSGKADDSRINSNDKVPNPNVTILELANKDKNYRGKVAAFGSWDVFPFIVNEERSGVPVNAGFGLAKGNDLTEREEFLNHLQPQVPSPWSTVRLDAFTHHYALEYMKKAHPKLVFIAYGETDDFAHDGDYGAYLKATHNTDGFIQELWDLTRKDPFYRDNTVFLVSTDHGRGTQPLETWTSHGSKVKNSGQVWLAAFGSRVTPAGEIRTEGQLYSTQIAPTIAALLGLEMDGSPIVLSKK